MLHQLVRRIQYPQQKPTHLRYLDLIESSDRIVGSDLPMQVLARCSDALRLLHRSEDVVPARPVQFIN